VLSTQITQDILRRFGARASQYLLYKSKNVHFAVLKMTDNRCLLCGEELSADEVSRRRAWHESCNKCPVCAHGPLDEDMLIKQLATGSPIGHTGCLESLAMRDLKDKTIQMRLEQIELLNREITTQWKIEPSLEDTEKLYKVLIRLQEAAANVSIVLGRTKEKIMVREASDYRQKTKAEREAEKETARSAAQAEIDKAKKQEILSAERENPALKLKRKALEGLMSIGLTKEQAEVQIAAMEAKKQ